MTRRYDVAVVGLGLFGAACVRYLARAGTSVVGIGPAEPKRWDERETVFASHYDSGRITRRIDRNHLWAELATRSIEAYGPLEERAGLGFHHPVGTLWADADRARMTEIAAVSAALDVPCRQGETGSRELVHGFRLPGGLSYAYEPDPAGYIDPRKLLRAQLAVATADGAAIVDEAVIGCEPSRAGRALRTSDGQRIEADRVVLATGAYANAYELAPDALPMRIKTEVTILVPVAPEAARALAALPTLIYGPKESPLSDFYLVPPTAYPDGVAYLKAGADTSCDLILSSREEMNAWMLNGDSERHHADFRRLLSELLPELELTGSSMKRCLISYTAHGLPYVDEIADGLFVLLGGNGRGAKSSDAIGKAAAGLVLGAWDATLPREEFRVPSGTATVPDATPL